MSTPQGVNTVYDFWEVLLLIQVRKFKDEALDVLKFRYDNNTELDTDFRKANSTNKIEEVVDIIRVPKIQFWRL